MSNINLSFIQAQLKYVSGFKEGDIDKINQLLNNKTTSELNEIKICHFDNKEMLTKYLKRSPQKDFKNPCIRPVNFLRYRIYQQLIENNKIDIKSFFDSFEPLFLNKDIDISDLPTEIQDIYKKYGWGSSMDPYHSWKDYRKIVYDYIITPNNYEKLYNELQKISYKFKGKGLLDKWKPNIKGPWGSQNNSFDDYCWIAWCPGESMKKTVHLGLQIYSDYFIGKLFVGDDFYKETHLENQALREKEFYDIEEAFTWLLKLKDICIKLNKNQKMVEDELQSMIQENKKLKEDTFTPQRTSSKDSLGLHTGSYKSKEPRTTDIESSHLYLFKIEGIRFESSIFQATGVFKIGMSINPDKRKVDIIKGFGLASLLSIKKIFVKTNKAKYETRLKEFIDNCSDFYYDGEFFCTELSDDKVKILLEEELTRFEMNEVVNTRNSSKM
ncbi:MAG: hypothetical protein JXK07_07490 [Spirochaetes bacterium]|nr:hypothetical protein [Spirochaetota bacterium]MBN2769697.1 hypothetical protein [Spirochaetota bacterium]